MPSEIRPESTKPVKSLEPNLKVKRDLTDQQQEKPTLPQVSRSKKLRDRLEAEKTNLSYADFHHEITKNVKDITASESCQRKYFEKKATKDDELVKYMSNLPSYLQRGENLKEKALNVGVLNWGHLEKWQYKHKQIPQRGTRDSSSSSNTSSSFSTDISSSHSSRDHSFSPARRRIHRPVLQYHLIASSKETHQVVKSFRENVGKFQDLNTSKSNFSNGLPKFPGKDLPFCKNNSEIKPEQTKRNDSAKKMAPEMRTLPSLGSYDVTCSAKGEKKTREGDLRTRAEKLPGSNSDIVDQDFPKGRNTAGLLLPRHLPRDGHSGTSQLSDSTTAVRQRSAEVSRRSFSEISREVHRAEFYSDIPHSCPLPCEVESSRNVEMKQSSSIDAESIKFSSNASHSVPCSTKIGYSPSRGGNLGEKKLTLRPTNATGNESLMGSVQKESTVAREKVRSSSPFRRFSIGIGKISKSSSSKEEYDLRQFSSTHISAKSVPENAAASACSNASNSDKLNASGRARSSPLRRLLDPLLKTKVANSDPISEPLQKDSKPRDRACKPRNGQLDALTVQSGHVKLVSADCRSTSNVEDSYADKKHESSAVQALLRVAFKNGLPLFTFAVDNKSDIFAATMKKLSTSRKDECRWIYTLFTVREVKKKNGSWINQGGKGKSLDYIPNVVAQMKVSDYQFSNLIRQNSMDQFNLREFVLYSMDLKEADQQILDSQPNDELAAIVVKIPTRSNQCIIKDGRFVGSQDLVSTTVILPSGVHSLPSKGEPSSLIKRWNSGGACDCGGWDLGCKLRILANRNHISNNLSSGEACTSTIRFELFSQGGIQESKHVFSLALFKDSIYSVEFDSSLSLLQAFSVCIAALDSRKLCGLSESSNLFEEKICGEAVSVQNDGTRAAPNQIDEEAPARYVSYPPHSPVGRV